MDIRSRKYIEHNITMAFTHIGMAVSEIVTELLFNDDKAKTPYHKDSEHKNQSDTGEQYATRYRVSENNSVPFLHMPIVPSKRETFSFFDSLAEMLLETLSDANESRESLSPERKTQDEETPSGSQP